MIDLTNDPRAKPFRMGGGSAGCLLVHGFTGSPWEMRPLGERLSAQGFRVFAPCLPGHGTRVEDLAATRWRDWYREVESGWEELARQTTVRVVAGLSMGALLALHLARERPGEVAALAGLAPALVLTNQSQAEHALWIARMPWLPRRAAIVGKQAAVPSDDGISPEVRPAYDEIPVRALASMIELQRLVRADLPHVTAPLFLARGGEDPTVSVRGLDEIEAGVASSVKRRRMFPRSGHVLTEDCEAEAVIGSVARFFAEVLGFPAVTAPSERA